jgi:DNA invertase Pin-like site-specific DNA recombinase
VVVVTRIDWLARSTRDFQNTLAELTEHGVGFRSIKDTGIDTSSATGQLVLQILVSIGEFERKLIQSRVEDGTKRAIARGVKFGRKPKLNRHQRKKRVRGYRLARRRPTWRRPMASIARPSASWRRCECA